MSFSYCEMRTIIIIIYHIYRETEPDWHLDIQDDVLEECNKYGNVVHIYVDKTSSEVSII